MTCRNVILYTVTSIMAGMTREYDNRMISNEIRKCF